MSDSRVAATEQLLTQILSNCAPFPELGARLKQRLIAASTAAGQRPFNEKALGFRKFSDYLQRAHGDILSLQRPDGMGDVLVSLKSALPIARGVSAAQLPTPIRLPSQPVIRSEVWQAFTNPDAKRKRFFYIPSGQIIHYRDGEPPPQLGAASPDEVIEILPISKETQANWMREFLDQASVPTQEKSVLEPLINEDYSSTVNATFSRALGPRSDAWRKFRTARVIEIILRWADDHEIDHALVHVRPTPVRAMMMPGEVDTAASATNQAASVDANPLSPREQVSKLLELLSDDDLTRLVIPTLLSTIMIKSQM
ncbi:hypothetical protein [Burkholderia gladioli]|uniref:hypothetical protein n=1 Tax=Burkholderia gladioli TaxID=28095 RepID=UPI00163ECE35|nr:hypothetical protein [Burkholderia gladioli]